MTSFSVVIPVYNKGPHVARAIQSALCQTHPAHEIIVVDDASNDASRREIERFAGRITLFSRTEPGPGGYAARNLAIRHASGEWIAFLDADDAWHEDHLKTLNTAIEPMQGERLSGAFSGYHDVYSGTDRRSDAYTQRFGRANIQTFSFNAFLRTWIDIGDCPVWTSASAFPRSKLLEAGLFPEGRCARGGDKDLWLRVARLGSMAAAPGITAAFHRDAVNKVTHKNGTNRRHCICATIEGLLKIETGETAHLLRRLYNREVFEYAKIASRTGRVNLAAWRGFFILTDPGKFIMLATLSFPATAAALRRVRAFLHADPASVSRALRP